MANYHEIVTQAEEHRSLLLENAEQRHLILALGPAQPHPIIAWVGQQLYWWRQQFKLQLGVFTHEPPTRAPTNYL